LPFGGPSQKDLIVETNFTKFKMKYKDDSKADLSLQETSQPATAFDSEIG